MEQRLHAGLLAHLLLALAPLVTVSGQKYSNEFLAIGVSARAQGMGNAVVANVSDVTAGYWNPAGLAGINQEIGLQLGAMHAEWFAGVGAFDYLGFTLPFSGGRRRLGVSLIRFGIDEIPNTLTLYESDGTINFDNVREFSAADYALLLSYAQGIRTKSGQLRVGGNIKIIHRTIGPFADSWGFGIDAAAQYQLNNWRFGLLAADLTSTFNAWSFSFTEEEKEILELTNNEVPINSVEVTNPRIVLGAGYQFRFSKGKIGIAPELDFIITTDGQRNTLISSDPFSIDPAFGLEADYGRFVFLRAGVNQFQQIQGFDGSKNWQSRPSLGVGFKISTFHVDYAFTDLGAEDDTYSHVISLQLDFLNRDR